LLTLVVRLGSFNQGVVSTGTGISVIKFIRPAAEIIFQSYAGLLKEAHYV